MSRIHKRIPMIAVCAAAGVFATLAVGLAAVPAAPQDQMARGREIFSRTCLPCHQEDGTGYAGLFPPLAKSDYFMADKARAIGVVLNGLTGPVTVNGEQYDNVMPAWAGELTDQEIADVMTYERNSWGNQGEPVTAEEVAAARAASKR